jgi:hypothetical protein
MQRAVELSLMLNDTHILQQLYHNTAECSSAE